VCIYPYISHEHNNIVVFMTVCIYRYIHTTALYNVPMQVSDIFDLTLSLKFNDFSFQILFLFVPEMSASFTYYIVSIIYIALVWIL